MTIPQKIHKVLQDRVKAYFAQKGIKRTANTAMKIKTVILVGSFIGSYLAMMIFHAHIPFIAMVGLFLVFSFAGIGIGFGVMHDANHGAYSTNKRVNKLLGYSINLLGYNKWIWTQRHNIKHHTQTNIDGHDDDIEAGTVMRFAKEQPYHWRHRFQRLYFLPLYSLNTLLWVIIGDFRRFYMYTKEVFVNKNTDHIKKKEFLKESWILYLSKAFYFIYMIGIPLLVGIDPRLLLKAFLLMHVFSGLLTALVFQCAHVRPDAETFGEKTPTTDANSFVIHQVESTGNFAPRSRIFSRYIGGLTHQIEHHLFPNICHIHYHEVRPIVKATLLEYGLPYNEYSTFVGAVWSHIVQMRQLSWKPKTA